jgi:ketosteroid isomerase-like protein
MKPTETVILNDSMAYDFGTSTVYFTNAEGKSVELYDTFLVLLKKGEDGNWRMYREVASSRIVP